MISDACHGIAVSILWCFH